MTNSGGTGRAPGARPVQTSREGANHERWYDVSDDVRVAEPLELAGSPPETAKRRNILTLVRETLLRRREASVLIVALALMGYFQYSRSVFLSQSNLLNIAQATAPTAIDAPVAGLLQPHSADCWKPNTLSATPGTISASPR